MDYAASLTTEERQPPCQSIDQFTAKRCVFGRWVVLRKKIKERVLLKRAYVECGKFSCPYCRAKKKRRLARFISKACPKSEFSFLTLTLKYNNDTLAKRWHDLNHFWDILLKRFKRQVPNVKYFRVVELQKNGTPHIHALINFYVPNWVVKEIWTELTGDSFIAKFEKVRSSCSGYILKYFSKSIQDIKYIRSATGKKTRIFNWSRNLFSVKKPKKGWELLGFFMFKISAVEFLTDYKNSTRTLYGRAGPVNILCDEYDLLEKFSFKTVEV